jgi:hypothetical protein
MTDLEGAISRGCAFLAAVQDRDGLWHDSEFPEKEGSAWVTAYIARCLWTVLSMPDSGDLEEVYEAACQGLARRQRRNGGWAYSAATATDAEATAWALICLLDRRDRHGFSTTKARRYLKAHLDEASGGFRFYAPTDDAEGGFGELRDPDIPCDAQPCVTGAVVRALVTSGSTGPIVTRACEYLKGTQGEDGMWRSALWTGPGAPTYLALSALDFAGALDDRTRARAWEGVSRIVREGRSYELAAALISAPRLDPTGNVADAVERLVADQEEDGSWRPTGRLRAVTPSRYPPTGAGDAADRQVSVDLAYRGRLLMTVTAVTALVFSGVRAQVVLRKLSPH